MNVANRMRIRTRASPVPTKNDVLPLYFCIRSSKFIRTQAAFRYCRVVIASISGPCSTMRGATMRVTIWWKAIP